jgi:hypothetical protein
VSATPWDDLERFKRTKRVHVGKARAGAPDERAVQRQIVKALRKMGMLVHHSPNGAHLSGDKFARLRQSAVLKADGMQPGFPDLIVLSAGRCCLIEVKREGGVMSPDQIAFASVCNAHFVPCIAVCSLDDTLAQLRGLGWL